MAKLAASNRRRVWMVILTGELAITAWMIWNCYQLGGCSSALCVPTGSALGATCLLVGLKTFLAFLGADAAAWLLIRNDRKKF